MSNNGKEYKIAIKIAGEIEKSLPESMRISKQELHALAKDAVNSSGSFKSQFESAFTSIGSGIGKLEEIAKEGLKTMAVSAGIASAAILKIGKDAADTGMEFESAFAGIKKTTDASQLEFDQMRAEIIALTREIPATGAEISAVGEAAGQLGIAKENVVSFSETMINLGESTNLAAEEAAENFAKFANITQMPQDEFDKLGSTIVDLGNNYATTESQIMEMSMRLAGAGNQAHFSPATIMGYAAALSSVGIEAEMGGSAFSKAIINMQVASETGFDRVNELTMKTGKSLRELELMSSNDSKGFKGLMDSIGMTSKEANQIVTAGVNLRNFADIAGMTSKEFKALYDADPSKAMQRFVAGLGDTEGKGKSTIQMLQDMGFTEVRLRDTLTRLASSGDLISGAVGTANQAWKENTALQEEAAKRYETTESKMKLLKNAQEEFNLSIYDSGLQDLMREGLSFASESFYQLIDGEKSNGTLKSFFESLQEAIPTSRRELMDFTESFLEFADPLIEVGKWLWDHPEVIESTIIGIGSAIITYKVAEGLISLVNGFAGLAALLTNPFAAAILAVGLAIGGATGLGFYLKKCRQQAAEANLEEHFGKLKLNIEDLEEASKAVVQSDYLGKIQESIENLAKMDELQQNINDAVKEFNKANWKISLGIELSNTEKEDYKANIQQYIQNCQDYIQEQQYSVNIAVGVLTDDDLEGHNIVDKVNEFYNGKQQELAQIGAELNKAITEAFKDGFLDFDEAEEITRLQQKMARIQAAVAGNNFDSSLDLLELKYSGKALSADSFQNLQEQIQKDMQAAVDDYDKAYTLTVSNAKLMLTEGSIDISTYDAMMAEYKQHYLDQMSDLATKANQFQLDIIQHQYKDELAKAMPEFQKNIASYMQDSFTNTYEWSTKPGMMLNQMARDIYSDTEMETATKDALAKLLDQMQPSSEQMEEIANQYREAGLQPKKSLIEGLNDTNSMMALTETTDTAIYKVLGAAMEDNPTYRSIIEMAKNQGFEMPKEMAESMANSSHLVQSGIDSLYNDTQRYLNEKFDDPMNVTTDVLMHFNSHTIPGVKDISAIPGHASGGIFDEPHLAYFSEDGPEAAIPLDRSRRSLDLWKQTGDALGAFDIISAEKSLQSQPQQPKYSFTFAPVLQCTGSRDSVSQIQEVLETEEEKFERNMNRWLEEHERTSFG